MLFTLGFFVFSAGLGLMSGKLMIGATVMMIAGSFWILDGGEFS